MDNNKCIIIRYSEIALKGKNRNIFEKRLMDNIRFYLNKKKIGYENIIKTYSRILIFTDKKINIKPVFGISSYSYAESFDYDYDILKSKSLELAKKAIKKEDTFRVSVQRIDKSIKKKSIDIEREIGEIIWEEMKNDVSLKAPDKDIGIELVEGKAYLFEGREEGYEGLPLGVDDSSSVIIEDKYSILSALMLMRRGIFLRPVFIAKDENIDLLKEYVNTDKKIEIIEVKNRKEAFDVIKERKIGSVVLNDFLEDIDERKEKDILILRPLVHLSEEEAKYKIEEFIEVLK